MKGPLEAGIIRTSDARRVGFSIMRPVPVNAAAVGTAIRLNIQNARLADESRVAQRVGSC